MSNDSTENKKVADAAFLLGISVMLINIAYYFYPLAYRLGLTNTILKTIMLHLHDGQAFRTPYPTKIIAVFFMVVGNLLRTGTPTERKLRSILIEFTIGHILFYIPSHQYGLTPYMICSLVGIFMCTRSAAHLARYFMPKLQAIDEEDTFPQNEKFMENKYSFNLRTLYRWEGRWRKGWINIINPFRMTMIQGAPGSGKSYSIFEPAFFQLMKKGFTVFCYDFKAPAQTEIVWNIFNLYKDRYIDKYHVEPEFHVINFDDPRYSERCNPIHPMFLNDPADATEISEIVMENVNKGAQGGQKFFDDSAKLYLDAIVWYLRIYKDGKYCTFPHAIELMAQSYKKTLKIMQAYPELEVKLKPFEDAMVNKALEQLSGQIASAQIPLNKFVSPTLYYVLSENDFSLDINNPEHPKILCLGNNPDRENIYGATTALYVSRLIKIVNKKGKAPCAFFMDELATFFIKGLDKLAATARSNLVAIITGLQTLAQLVRDYKKEEADVINENFGNVFYGASRGQAAETASKMFGKHKVVRTSISTGDNDSFSISYQEEERLPASRIETLHQGMFCGKQADDFGQEISRPFFCAKLIRDPEELKEMKKFKKFPMINDFGQKEVEEQVEKNKRNYIAKALRPAAERQFEEECGGTPDELVIEEILTGLINDVTEEQEKKILKEAVEKEMKKIVDGVIDDAYQKVRREVKYIVDTEYEKCLQREEEERRRQENQNAINAASDDDPSAE